MWDDDDGDGGDDDDGDGDGDGDGGDGDDPNWPWGETTKNRLHANRTLEITVTQKLAAKCMQHCITCMCHPF